MLALSFINDEDLQAFSELSEELGYAEYPSNLPPVKAELLSENKYTFGDTLRGTKYYDLPVASLGVLPNKISYQFFPINSDEGFSSNETPNQADPQFIVYPLMPDSIETAKSTNLIEAINNEYELSKTINNKTNLNNTIVNNEFETSIDNTIVNNTAVNNYEYKETKLTKTTTNKTHSSDKTTVENNYATENRYETKHTTRRTNRNVKNNNIEENTIEQVFEDIEENNINYIRTAEHRLNRVISNTTEQQHDVVKETQFEYEFEKTPEVEYDEIKMHRQMLQIERQIEDKIEANNKQQEAKFKKMLNKFQDELLS